MKLRYKILTGLMTLLLIGFSVLAIAISHNSACEPGPGVSGGADTMQAIVYRCYGSPDVLELEDVEKPSVGDDDILVRVLAAGVNPLDWHYMRGSPYLMRLAVGLGKPDDSSMGVDFAGRVEAVGKNVTRFSVGDEVFGGKGGAFAEYVMTREDRALAHKPANISFEQAAAMPVAAITALQALRDKGRLKPGQKVLINGASGGVGTYAVQIAKALGAEVTGVCSTRNVEMVSSLGADHVIDYKQQDYTQSGQQYDVIIDNVGNHSLLKNRGVLTDEGIFVGVGASSGDWIGPLARPVNALLLSPFVSQEFVTLMAKLYEEDLESLGEMAAAGKVKSVIDRRFSLAEVPEAIRYSEQGRARGKIVVTLE